MPFFLFFCDSCSVELKKLMNSPDSCLVKCKKCGGDVRQVIGSPAVDQRETTDEYRGKSNDPEIRRKLNDRAKTHFKEHQLPRIVEEKGKEFALETGLIDHDGRFRK
jgi:predicted nucleic acid-binding Zn ribbon protein